MHLIALRIPAAYTSLILRPSTNLFRRIFDFSKVEWNVLLKLDGRSNREYFIFYHMLDLSFHCDEEEDTEV
jgi:hypothetical protein